MAINGNKLNLSMVGVDKLTIYIHKIPSSPEKYSK